MTVIQESAVPAPRPRLRTLEESCKGLGSVSLKINTQHTLTPRELGHGEKLSNATEDLRKNLSKTGEKLMKMWNLSEEIKDGTLEMKEFIKLKLWP
jgi:hypothetical protein